MPDIMFHSGLRYDLYDFLNYKRKLGAPYRNGAYYLADFDRHCAENHPGETRLEKHVCLAWAARRPTETASGLLSRVTPVRQFGKYLAGLGRDAFILPEKLGSQNGRPLPYIFSMDDLVGFFAAADNMERYYQSVVRHLVAPLMFRYLYCCGLRPQEARRLCVEDLNIDTGRLFIKESKGLRERIVMIPPELLNLTKVYLDRINGILSGSAYLFPNRYGNGMSYDGQNYLFKFLLEKSGISSVPKPNLYSFRHSYATHRLYLWMKEGHDISAKLPYLSAFMGHSDFSCTAYYIHLVPGLFKEMAGMDLSRFETLIPEVATE